LDMVTIFKEVYACGGQACADLEISGRVKILRANKKVRFRSNISGRLLFSIEKGAIVWGHIRNSEVLTTAEQKVAVESCLDSILVEPKNEAWPGLKKPNCLATAPVGDLFWSK